MRQSPILNFESLIHNSRTMKTTLLYILFAITIVLILSVFAIAQPGLPTVPSQAPIDGGLGLLAAAGGTYAWKKLRDRKNEETDI
jgi:hypothetical protein